MSSRARSRVLLYVRQGTKSPLRALWMDKWFDWWAPHRSSCPPSCTQLQGMFSARAGSVAELSGFPLTSSLFLYHVPQLSAVEISTEGQTSSQCSIRQNPTGKEAGQSQEGSVPEFLRDAGQITTLRALVSFSPSA